MLSGADLGATIWVEVSLVDDAGFVESLTSAATVAVAERSDSAPTVSDTSLFRNHDAAVGVAFRLVLPAADPGSGNGGPYEYRCGS